MKKILSSVLFLCLLSNQALAETVWADDSINDLIIKEYDANALRDKYMPALPDSLKNEHKIKPTAPSPSTQPETPASEKNIKTDIKEIPTPITPVKSSTVTVKKGTKFKLRIDQAIDDSINIGTKVYFTSLYPESSKYITIPAGTRFIGTVQDAHLPQITSNGGLLVISIDEFIYKGHSYPIEAQIINVGNKRIFYNNIKGKHSYWANIAKSTKPGRKFYAKTWKLTKEFANDGLEVILTPITFVSGATVLAVNTVAAPAIAFFSKGGRLFINKGTHFKIKLLENSMVHL